MSKVSLTFNLPQEMDEYQVHIDGPEYQSAAHEFHEYLRGLIKYNLPKGMHSKTVEIIQKKFFEIMNDHDLEIL